MREIPPGRRSSRHRAGPSWTQPIVERLTPVIKGLVIANALVYAFYVFGRALRPLIAAHVALGPGLFQGEVWQPLTSLFVHFDLLGFIFNMIGLWFVGATIERTQGTRRFVTVFFGAGVLSNVAIAAVSHFRLYRQGDVFDGCALGVLALFVAFGRIYGRAPAQVIGALYLQARTLAYIFVGFAAVMSLAQGDWAQLAGLAVAVAVGYLGAAPGGFAQIWAAFKARRVRRRYRVIDGGAGRPRKTYLN